MDKEILSLSSKLIEISEHDNYKEATFLISVLDEYNLNNVLIAKKEGEKYHQTIVGYPIVTYLKYDKKGKPSDFGGHELRSKINSETKEIEYYFATFPIGSVTESWIEDREVEGYDGEKSCVLIKTKLWSSRFPNYFDVFDKLWTSGELSSSWEISVNKSKKTKTGKQLLDFEFIGNCILGSTVTGAVPGAGVLEVSEKENESNNKLVKAFLEDIKIIQLLELKQLKTSSIEDVKNNKKINKQGGNEDMEDKKNETSSLTINDLYQKVSEQLNPKGWSSTPYYSIVTIYPEDHKALCKNIDNSSEDDLVVFDYTVSENDEITLGEGVATKLSKVLSEMMNVNISMNLDDTAKLLSEKETKIKEVETELSTTKEELDKVKTELSQKVEAITKLGEEMTNKDSLIAELTPLKEAHDKMIAEQEAQELAEKQESLKVLATKGGYITSEELETSEELKAMVDSLDEKGIKAEIASRVIAKLDETKPEVETSSIENKTTKTDLNNTDEGLFSATDIIKSILKKK